MKTLKKILPILLVCLLAVACSEPVESEGPEELTKSEAAAMGGKSDTGVDFCDWFGWYGDGICDTFCVNPDPDCDAGYDPCSGLSCGDTCTLCEPGDADCFETAVVKVCQPDGSCSADTGDNCSDSFEPCDGKACGESCTVCDPADPNCFETAVVKACSADGSCVAETPDLCTAYNPCDGKACGDTCTICDPADPNCVETAVVKMCQADGSCSATVPNDCPIGACNQDADCVVTGCSGQVCASEPVFTTCEFLPEYACYQDFGSCECVQGTCGWAMDPALDACLNGN